MLNMCGGKMARGDDQFAAFTTANSAVGSETGSSDEPRIETHEVEDAYPYFGRNTDNSQMEDTVQQPVPQAGFAAGTSNLDTMAGSQNSGSQKRKSTDEGVEMSKGKKIQRRISEKSKGINNIVETGAKLIKLQDKLINEFDRANNLKEERYREIDRCLEKLKGLKLDRILFHIIRGKLKDADERRFFLHASEEELLGWIDLIKFQEGMNQSGHGFYPQQRGMINNAQNSFGFFNTHIRPPQE